MRIVFFGTPQLSADFLNDLFLDSRFEIVGVVCQPDELVGRKKILTAPPTKVLGEQHGVPVFQPTKLKDEELHTALRALHADAFVVVAYGRIIPQAILDIAPLGCINVHPSLLPKYRGPSPLQAAIAAGDDVTGVTIMQLDAGMDHGPILAQEELTLAKKETPDTLTEKVVALGSPLLRETLLGLAAGTVTPQEQDHDVATLCSMLSRENGVINWQEPAKEIEQKIRAYTPWPGTTATWMRNGENVVLKIFTVEHTERMLPLGSVLVENNQLLIGTSTTALRILELQPSAGKRMDAASFLRGYADIANTTLT